jgi:type III restriction enzyme
LPARSGAVESRLYYDEFDVVPSGLREKLRQGKLLVRNWHALAWESRERLAKKRSVDKRGAKSDEAYVREVLGELASARQLLVINDEAHHAWRGAPTKGVSKQEVEEATVWVGGLDRIHAARGILAAYDFSATPFVPSGKSAGDEALFQWIVSDFGLSDAIESGLVKTPRVVIRDDGVPDAKTYKSKLFHIYPHVAADLARKAEENVPLPDLVTNAYYLLGKDWLDHMRDWEAQGSPVRPAMITVANNTHTAARIRHAFETNRIGIRELCDRERLLHIDSKVLELAEELEEPEAGSAAEPGERDDDDDAPVKKLTKQQEAERLRKMVDTVGRPGEPGERIQNVISVGMLSEGWDAKTVTHIMALRAFTSQLLCEQVVGRGLRRTAYDVDPETGLYEAEFVNVFGVPFTFLPHETQEDTPPPPTKAKTRIEPLDDRKELEIAWPNVLRIDQAYGNRLALDQDRVPLLTLNAHETLLLADLAPTVEGKPDVTKIDRIRLEELGRQQRYQTLAFRAAADVFEQMKPGWSGSREVLLGQLVALVEKFLISDRIHVEPPLFFSDPLRRRIMLALNMNRIVQHLFEAIRPENTTARKLVLDSEHPIRTTGEMLPWYTTKPCVETARSHVSKCVCDSAWEASEAFQLDASPHVAAWVKNDHLGFEIHYVFQGVVRRYRPDFLVRLATGKTLVLEVKGKDTPQDRAKRASLEEWIAAVNEHGGFGRWVWAVSFSPSDVAAILVQRDDPHCSPSK